MKKGRLNIWFILVVICAVLVIGGGILYMVTRNISAVMLILLFAAAGVGAYYKSSQGGTSVPTVTAEAPTTGKVNCFCIYGVKENGINKAVKIQFEYKKEEESIKALLASDRWFFEELNQWLPVIYTDLIYSDGDWAVFELPDAKYTDPARLAIQLNRSAYRLWRQLEESLFEKLKPAIMLGANVIVWFFTFLILSSPTPGG